MFGHFWFRVIIEVKSPFLGPGFSFFNGFDDMDDPFFSPFGGPSRGANAFRSQSFTHGSPVNERKASNRKQDPPIEHDLYLSLEEVLNGCVKKMKISRKVLNQDGKTYKKEDKVLLEYGFMCITLIYSKQPTFANKQS